MNNVTNCFSFVVRGKNIIQDKPSSTGQQPPFFGGIPKADMETI